MSRGYFFGAASISLALVASGAAGQSRNKPLAEAPQSTVGAESVAEALISVRSNQNVVFTSVNGWLIATDEAAYTIWSFAPEGDPAYPAVVKRQVIPQGIGSIIEMNVLCEATKEACDNLVRTFAEMNGFALDD
jgi:hypothetical protein